MNSSIDKETIRQIAQQTLDELHLLDEVLAIDAPGEFVFSPPAASRLVVRTMDELHAARVALRERFGWRDHLANKFTSGGQVIVTFKPEPDVKLPFRFALWVDDKADTFPKELLGACRVERVQSSELAIACPVG